jgi:ABC-type uncharacterized transport system substrate-binding protein
MEEKMLSIAHRFARRLALTLTAIAMTAGPALAQQAEQPLKIFHVMSFDSPWRWTDGQFAGFKEGLGEDVKAEYKVFQMDIKRHATPEAKAERGAMARKAIDEWKPDLVYISDDAGIENVAAHYANTGLPIVFSGANRTLTEHKLEGTKNITGVLEEEHFVESVRLLRTMAPNVRRIAVICDEAAHWPPVIQRIRDRVSRLEGVEIAAVDVLGSYAEFQNKVRKYPEVADAVLYLGIFNFKDDKGQTVPYESLQRWVVENSKLPDISFWIDRIHFGVLASVTVSEQEQGIAAGRLARAILVDGKAPSTLPVVPTVKGKPVINLARARQLGITVKSTELLTAEVVTEFQWAKAAK